MYRAFCHVALLLVAGSYADDPPRWLEAVVVFSKFDDEVMTPVPDYAGELFDPAIPGGLSDFKIFWQPGIGSRLTLVGIVGVLEKHLEWLALSGLGGLSPQALFVASEGAQRVRADR